MPGESNIGAKFGVTSQNAKGSISSVALYSSNYLFSDYKVDEIAIIEREQKGKFAGSAKGFKMETAIQLIEELDVRVFSTTEIKEQLKRNPIPIAFEDTGLKKYQENAFVNAYVYIMKKTYRSDEL